MTIDTQLPLKSYMLTKKGFKRIQSGYLDSKTRFYQDLQKFPQKYWTDSSEIL